MNSHVFNPFVIALLIGLLVGVEREKAKTKHDPMMGVRTFVILALLGALAGWVNQPTIALVILIFSFSLVAISYWAAVRRNLRDTDLGLTTEFTAGVVLILGYNSHQSPQLAILLGVLVALLLFSKRSLHRFTDQIRPSEFQTVVLLLLFGVGVVGLLKDQPLDPWGVFNPRKFGVLVLTLSILEFTGYLAEKILGARKAIWVTGFLGGLVSSTAVTISSARNARLHPGNWRIQAGAIIASQIAALLALLGIITFASEKLGVFLIPRIGAVVFVGILGLIGCARSIDSHPHKLMLKSPVDIFNVLRLSFFLGILFITMGVIQHFLGSRATNLFVFVTGFFELHGVSLATASMYTREILSQDTAAQNIGLAMIGSFFAKMILTWINGPKSLSIFLSSIFCLMAFLSFYLFCT